MKKDSRARAKGAERANQARSAWEEHALLIYAQFLHERPSLKPKERRYEVAKWMNENSAHARRITDAMMLGALRRPGTKATLAALKEMFEAPDTNLVLSDEGDREVSALAEEMTRFTEARYSHAFSKFVEAMTIFRAACIEADMTDGFPAEVQRAVKAVRDKPPARAKRAPAKK